MGSCPPHDRNEYQHDRSRLGQTVGMGSNRALPLVALGGVVGAFLRWAILDVANDDVRSFALLAINALGAALVGWIAGRGYQPGSSAEDPDKAGATVWPLIATGFAGGLTSFATFTVDVAARFDRGEISNAMTLTILSVILAVGLAGFLWRRGWISR